MPSSTAKETLPIFSGRTGLPTRPFEISSLRDSTIIVNLYSAILSEPNTRTSVPIIGTGQEFTISYGQKVFLEIYFDRLLKPALAILSSGDTWKKATVQKKQADGTIVNQHVYPSEFEFITSADVKTKAKEIADRLAAINTAFAAAFTSNDLKRTNHQVTDLEWQTEEVRLTKLEAQVNTILSPYAKEINKFFDGGIPAQKKLFRLFKMVAYTTKDFSANLPGLFIIPAASTRQPTFKIVPCVTTNLFLADYCYQNIPCKLAIPWTQPVFEYKSSDGKIEDKTNYDVPA